jgi:outer membrane protein TolC
MRRWIGLGLWAAALAAGQEPGVMPLTLEQAVEMALAPTGALRLQLAQELIAQAEAQRGQARAALLPGADGAYTFRSFTNNLEAFGVKFEAPGLAFQAPRFVGPIETSDWRAQFQWNVLDLSAWSRYRAAGSRLKAASWEERAARLRTAAEVVRAYTGLQRAQQMVETARANVELAERLRRLAESRKAAGAGTGIEIARAGVQAANEQARLAAAREERAAAELRLLRAMNLPLTARVEVRDELRDVPAEIPDAAALAAEARQARPELRAQEERRRAAGLGLEAARWERLPSVQAFGDYGVIGTGFTSGFPTRSVGVRLNVPVFDGGRRDARRAEAAAVARQEELRTRDAGQQVEMEVRLAVEALRSAEAQARMAAEALALAEQELAQAERRTEAGVAPGLEVTDAQTRVARAREQRVNALYLKRAARVELGVAAGNLESVLR